MQTNNKKCSIHQQRSIIGFCVSKSCKNSRSCCLKCLNEFHKEHSNEVVEEDEVQQLIEKYQKSLESVLYQITELEGVIKIIKLFFQSLIKQNTPDLENQQLLIDQIETVLKTDNAQPKVCSDAFLITMKQMANYAECIFNFKMDEFEIKEDSEKLNQARQLLKQDGCSKSIEFFENMFGSQQPIKQITNIQSLISIIFQSQGIIQEKQQVCIQNFQFSTNLSNSNITITQNLKKAEQTINQKKSVALILPPFGKSGCMKIKFRICQLACWIGLGLCKKELVAKNNYCFVNYKTIGHGYYINSSNSFIYSHIDSQINNKTIQNFSFTTNDIIQLIVDLDLATITWNNETKNMQYNMKFQIEDDLYFCARLCLPGDSVEIIQ